MRHSSWRGYPLRSRKPCHLFGKEIKCKKSFFIPWAFWTSMGLGPFSPFPWWVKTKHLRFLLESAQSASGTACHGGWWACCPPAASSGWARTRSPGSRRSWNCPFHSSSPCKHTQTRTSIISTRVHTSMLMMHVYPQELLWFGKLQKKIKNENDRKAFLKRWFSHCFVFRLWTVPPPVQVNY